MQETNPRTDLAFGVSASIIGRLGEEALKNEKTAVVELVKNSYDADAKTVVVTINQSNLRIQDDGAGMSERDLKDKWCRIATENKVAESRSEIFKRRRLGHKGVGRFACQKLGQNLVLTTSRRDESHLLQVAFDWQEFTGEKSLDEVRFSIKRKRPTASKPLAQGTILEISELNDNWEKRRVRILRNLLMTLVDPAGGTTDFRVVLRTPWPDLNGELRNPLIGKESHRLEFSSDAAGQVRVKIFAGEKQKRADTIAVPIQLGPIRGYLRYFGDGLRKSESSRGGSTEEDWNMGVRIFRDGFRIRPYGEPGEEGDWLGLYRRRYRQGSRFRLKPHYLEGAIYITREENPGLRDTTSREGLDENESYEALVALARDLLNRLNDEIYEEEVIEQRKHKNERYKSVLSPLTSGLNELASHLYSHSVEETDKKKRREVSKTLQETKIRNAHWECLDCGDTWKAPLESVPQKCREHSVGRDGKPTQKPGCGSTNIQRKENKPPGPGDPGIGAIDDVISGVSAVVSGKKLTPLIDWDMGSNDEEAEVRPIERTLAINGRHRAFVISDRMDAQQMKEGETLDQLKSTSALIIHIINAAAGAWARWHFYVSDHDFEEFERAYAQLKDACLRQLEDVRKAS